MAIVREIKKDQNQINKEFDEIKNLLSKKSNGFNKPYVMRKFHENPGLRKAYLATIKHTPARISEISEDALLTKQTCYSQLHHLMELHIVERIFAMDVLQGKIKDDILLLKFNEWTKHMPESLKRYYLAKTSYWKITEYGKEFAKISYTFEQEFRETEQRKYSEIKVEDKNEQKK